MPSIIEFPTIVQQAVEQFGAVFANEPERRHFAEYLTGLLVAAKKNVTGINAEFAERFGLGYAPNSGLLGHLHPKDPVSTGLFVKNDSGDVYDRFRRRLMFPIWNERGKVIAFGGRALQIVGE